MVATYTPDKLRTLFQSSFNLAQWYSVLQHFFNASELKKAPERIIKATSDDGYYLGNINTTDNYRIGLFQYNITKGSVANKRVGLRNLVKSFVNPTWGEFDAALVVFDSRDHWRLSFICDIKGEATSPKRYTYVFGSNDLLYRTPIERFTLLQRAGISFENLKTAFSVEALSDEFFDKYREQYADFIQYVTGKRFVKVGSKWEEKTIGEPDEALMQAFGYNEKKIRDYIKKMMGRITFLHFLQRKGWMCGDLNYMQNLFNRSKYQNDYLDSVLEPLFFGILNTKPDEREALFEDYGWDKSLLKEWKDIPYLNGGLFERDEDDEPESKFPAEYFKRLFQFFSEYNFTIDENDPNDAEVGVDPEMLGKIFENLLEDNKDKGAFYTPKEIVRYMCQESLIAYLDTNTSIASEKIRKFVLSPEDGILDIPETKKAKLLTALEEVKICDPAIGSGAFPMGLLNELLHCREVLSGERYDRAKIKKDIIRNNIYGVDIEKGAIDIARLRFWLSIVVDEETPSPLPNLDYKIMQGNSLIESFKGVDLSKLTYEKESKKDNGEYSLFDDETNLLQKKVSRLLSAYYSCYDHNKKIELQQQISDTINKQLEVQAYNQTVLAELKTINLAENNKFFLWHTWFSDVFNRKDGKNGFDIVIGNPPYMFLSGKGSPVKRLESEGKNREAMELQKLINQYVLQYSDVSNGCKDYYKWFYMLALNICRSNGIVAYITPNTFFNMPKYKDLRQQLFKHHIILLSDLGFSVFNAPTVPSAICIIKKDNSIQKTVPLSDIKMVLTSSNRINIRTFIEENTYTIEIENNELNAYKNDIAKRIYNSPKYIRIENFLSFVEGEHGIQINKDLISFSYNPQSLPVLFDSAMVRNGYVEIGYLPFTPLTKNNLHCGDRAILRKTGDTICVSIPRTQKYAVAHQNVYVVKEKVKYSMYFWMGFLNSKLLTFLYQNGLYGQKGRTMAQFRIYALNALPCPPVISKDSVNEIKSSIIKLQNSCSLDERVTIENHIDRIIYKLYDLSDDDIKIIEQSV